jgi:two-component system, OmpR family, response regulator
MHLLYAPSRPPDTYLLKALAEAGHVVEVLADWGEAQSRAAAEAYDAVLLDAAGLDVPRVRRMAGQARGAAVVALADLATPKERAAILRAGADACFVRPLHFIELELRLEALARRPTVALAAGAMALSGAERTARVGDEALALSPQEFRLLDYLARHPARSCPPTASRPTSGATRASLAPTWCAPASRGCGGGCRGPSARASSSPSAATAIASTPMAPLIRSPVRPVLMKTFSSGRHGGFSPTGA